MLSPRGERPDQGYGLDIFLFFCQKPHRQDEKFDQIQ